MATKVLQIVDDQGGRFVRKVTGEEVLNAYGMSLAEVSESLLSGNSELRSGWNLYKVVSQAAALEKTKQVGGSV